MRHIRNGAIASSEVIDAMSTVLYLMSLCFIITDMSHSFMSEYDVQ